MCLILGRYLPSRSCGGEGLARVIHQNPDELLELLESCVTLLEEDMSPPSPCPMVYFHAICILAIAVGIGITIVISLNSKGSSPMVSVGAAVAFGLAVIFMQIFYSRSAVYRIDRYLKGEVEYPAHVVKCMLGDDR